MKILTHWLFLAACLVRVHAADPVIVIQSATSVTVDGVPSGSIVDVLANNPKTLNLRARLLDAWVARESAIVADAAARVKTAEAGRNAADTRVAAIVAALKNTQISAPLPAEVVQAILSDDEKTRASLEAQRAEIDAKLAKLP